MMKRLKSDGTDLDRLSELPDSLIHKILSFLIKTKEVVTTTSLLSKRWTYLWTTIPFLNFIEDSVDFINGVLHRWKGTQLLEFRICFGKALDKQDMDYWVGFATDRKVENLFLLLPYDEHEPLESNPAYSPPHCLYSCSSIENLHLIGCNLEICGNLQWLHLKSLTIHGYCIAEDTISQVVSSSPRLEILEVLLFGRRQKLNIQSSSLKKFKLKKYLLSLTYDPSNYASLTIWAPNLEMLCLSGAVFSQCLVTDVSSLVHVALDFVDTCDVAIGETLSQFLPTIQHVEVLALSPWCFKMLGVMMKGKSLTNVKLLKLMSVPLDPNDIRNVLVEIFPKVEKLEIYWTLCNPSSLAMPSSKYDIGEQHLELESNEAKTLMQLRTVEITWYVYEAASIFQFIRILLKHATMVQKIQQKIVIGEKAMGSVDKARALVLAGQELLSLQRNFPTIHLSFFKCTPV